MKYAVYAATATSTRKPASRERPQTTYRLVGVIDTTNAATAILAATQSPVNRHLIRKNPATMGAVVWTGTGNPPAEVRIIPPQTLAQELDNHAQESRKAGW